MTDVPSSPDDNDAELLASLYVDGEATPEERARVEADPELLALVETYRSQAVALADVTPPTGQRAAHLAAAMDLFDELTAETSTAPAAASATAASTATEPSEVSSLADGRRRREERQQRRGLTTWLGAAAGLVLVVGGLGFVASNLSTGDDDAATEEVALNPSSAARSDENAEDDGDDAAMELSTDAASSDMAEAMEEEAMEAEESFGDAAEDDAADNVTDETADAATAAAEPIDLAGITGQTAADFLAVLPDAPRQDTDTSDCAATVRAIADADGFISVIFRGELAELHALAPDGAVIVSPGCEVVLE